MLPDRVSNPGPLTYESGALSIALRGLAVSKGLHVCVFVRAAEGGERGGGNSILDFHGNCILYAL